VRLAVSITRMRERSGRIALVLCGGAWVVLLVLIARHRVFVTFDSLNNYGHVWYVADRLRHGHGIPFRMPVLGHGKAYAFPYAFVPWLSAAVLFLVFDDWAVTAWLVIGTVLLIAAMFWALPEIRRGWWAAAALIDPFLVMVPTKGQLPFAWACAGMFAAIALWRRHQRGAATVFAALAQASHPGVVLPMMLVLVVFWWWFERDRRALARCYLISLVVALPAALLLLASPVASDAGLRSDLYNFWTTVGVRQLVVSVPIALAFSAQCASRPERAPTWFKPLLHATRSATGPICFAILLGISAMYVLPGDWLDTRFSWGAIAREPDPSLLAFIHSPQFDRDATYRVLRAGGGKVGFYQLLRAGARLDSEFFPESFGRQHFTDTAAYERFLRNRHVDVVVLYDNFDQVGGENEPELLASMTQSGNASSVARYPAFTVFRIGP